MTSYREQSKPVTLSGYLVSSSLVDYLEDGIPIPCDDRRITRIPEYKGEELVCRSDGTFHSQPEGTAEDVGDIRVTFAYLPPGTVSMIARHEGGELSLVADKEGTYLDLIKAGEYSPEELVQIAQGEWVDRASRAAWFSGIVLCLGLFLIVAPLWKNIKDIPDEFAVSGTKPVRLNLVLCRRLAETGRKQMTRGKGAFILAFRRYQTPVSITADQMLANAA